MRQKTSRAEAFFVIRKPSRHHWCEPETCQLCLKAQKCPISHRQQASVLIDVSHSTDSNRCLVDFTFTVNQLFVILVVLIAFTQFSVRTCFFLPHMKPVFFPFDIDDDEIEWSDSRKYFPDLKLFLFDLFGLICQSGVEKTLEGFPKPLQSRIRFTDNN